MYGLLLWFLSPEKAETFFECASLSALFVLEAPQLCCGRFGLHEQCINHFLQVGELCEELLTRRCIVRFLRFFEEFLF